MDVLLGLFSLPLILGVFGLLYWSIAGAQQADNRNSNSDQSSYTSTPPSSSD